MRRMVGVLPAVAVGAPPHHAYVRRFQMDSQTLEGELVADRLLLTYVRQWAARIGVAVPQIHLRRMKGKWASISTAGRLTLNAELLGLPKDLGEFVIVHELVHLLAPNHGPVFKSFLYAYLPDWETRACQLRAYTGLR